MGEFRDRRAKSVNDSLRVMLTDPELQGFLPAVHEYMTECVDKNGKSCETATLMVFADPGRWTLAFKDRSKGETLWTGGALIREALEALESHLQNGTGDWRAERSAAVRTMRK